MVQLITKTRKILANNIVYYRLKHNLSQEDFAELLGTSSVYISQMENAKRNISCDYIDHIASTLKIQPIELLRERTPINIRRIDRKNKR